MKHIYYGVRHKTVPMKDFLSINDLDVGSYCYLSSVIRELNKESVERYINRLKKGINVLIKFHTIATSDDVYIMEKDQEYVCKEGDIVSISNKEGRIHKTVYDANTNIIHCYSDIVLSTVEDDNYEEKLESMRQEIIEDLERIYEKYMKEDESQENSEKNMSLLQRFRSLFKN